MDQSRDCFCDLSSDYLNLYLSKEDADVTFVLPDGELKAHKSVLVARLTYFDRMFSSGMAESLTNRIKVSDSRKKAFDDFLRFVYCGKVRDNCQVEPLLGFAHKYDVPDLLPHCLPKIKAGLAETKNFDTCLAKVSRMLGRGEAGDFPEVKKACEDELEDRVNREHSLLIAHGRLYGHYYGYADSLERFFDRIARLLLLSQEVGWLNLKELCFQYFMNLRPYGSSLAHLSDSLKKLKEEPDLLVELVEKLWH